jgi:hypothetical protein
VPLCDILYIYTVFVVRLMLVKIAQMFEDSGRPLARNRAVTQLPVYVGKLSMCDQHDRLFRRSVCTAYLRSLKDGSDVIPPLRDAVVRWIDDLTITISGLEQDSTSNKCTQQAWLAQLITDEWQ